MIFVRNVYLNQLSTKIAGQRLSMLLIALLGAQAVAANTNIETTTVTASRTEQTLEHLASSMSVIVEQQLQQISAVHITEALSRVPGVWVSRGNGQEHLTAIRSPVLTGAGSCSAFYIAEDNVPVRSAGFCNVNQLFDINTEQAQQIEVLRGPGTVLHGSNALHGVINVLNKAPSTEAEQLLSFEAGPHDYNRVKFSASDTHGTQGYRINLNGTHDTGYKDESGFDQQKFSFLHNYTQDSTTLRTLLSMSNLNQETAGYVEGINAYKNRDRAQENPNPEAHRESQSLRIQTRIEKRFDKNGVFIMTPYARYTEMDFLMHFLPGTPEEENGQRSAGVLISIRRDVSKKLSLTNGFDSEYTHAYLKQTQTAGFSSFPSGKHYDYDVSAKVFALFLNGDYQLTPTTTLSAGVRYESLKYDYDNQMIAGDTAEDGSICVNSVTTAVGCRYSRPEDRSDNFENGSFTAGVVHHVNDQLSIISRLAHGFRAPQTTELYRLQAGQLEANLDSEEVDSLELGLRANYNRFSYSFTGFLMKKNNVIFQSSDRRNLDDGQTEHYGLEYQLSWQLSNHLSLSTSGTVARHQYGKDVNLFGSDRTISIEDNDIDTSPHHMGTVRLDWHITSDSIVELEWLHLDKYYTDINNLHSYEGHKLLNLRLRQQWGENVSVGLRITNLTDTNYAERADFTEFGGNRYFIGEPRSAFADISLKF